MGTRTRQNGSVAENRPKTLAQLAAEHASKLEIRAGNARDEAERLTKDAEQARHIAKRAAHVAKSLPEGWDQC